MKVKSIKNKAAAILVFALLTTVMGFGQALSKSGGRYIVSAYGRWSVTVQNGNTSTGTTTITLNQGAIALQDGRTITPFSTAAPITLDFGANTETVTPTAVSGCSASGPASPSTCQVTANFSFTHGQGTQVASGSAGLQEAINDAASAGGGVVAVDTTRVTNAILAAAIPQPNVVIEDDRGTSGGSQFLALRPSTLSLIPAGAIATFTQAAGGALTSLGTYLGAYEYVDINGGISLPSTESATLTLTGSNQTAIMAAPAASAGAVGYIPLITASGGSTGTEIEVPLTSSVCTLTTLETAKPACAVTNATYGQTGSAATIAANPSGTAKEVVIGTAHTTAGYAPTSSVQTLGGIQTSYGPFATVATVSTTALPVAQVFLPAGVMNSLGKELDICFVATGTVASTGIPSWTLHADTQFLQSSVTLATVTFATVTGAVDWQGCFSIQTAATGTSGTFLAKTLGPIDQILNGTPTTVQNQGQVTTAASSAIDLTKGIYLYLDLVSTTANTTAVTVNGLSLRTPN